MSPLHPYSLSLILTLGGFSCVKAAMGLEFVSHDALTRALGSPEAIVPEADWANLADDGELVIDDSIVAKPYSRKNPLVRWVYSSSEERILPGMPLLLALWVSPTQGEQVVMAVLVEPDTNRNELVQDLLKRLRQAGKHPKRVLVDAWFAASKTLNLIDEFGWQYVVRIKGNRLFNGHPLTEEKFFGAQGRRGTMKGVSHAVQVVKHHERYLMTNDLKRHHTSCSLAQLYQHRWVIETVFRALKQTLHLQKCSCETARAQRNHVLCVLQAYTHLRQAFPELSLLLRRLNV